MTTSAIRPPSTVRVAVVQMTSTDNVAHNVALAQRFIREAAAKGATYVQLPEYFNYYGSSRLFSDVAETVPGPTTDVMAQLARELGVVVHLGSLVERSPSPSKFQNTSVVIDERGEIVATYRKAHLFDIDVADEVSFRESDTISAGDQLVVTQSGGLNLGLTICFDVRFPELYRALALRGATVFSVPAAFAYATGQFHWEILLRARALENHAYVLAAAQVGATGSALPTWGHAMVVGPWGEIVGSLGEEPGVLVVDIDLNEVERRRQHINVLGLRRPDLYGS